MLWLLTGAAAIVAGAATARPGTLRGRLSTAAMANGYPSTSAASRSWLPGGGSERASVGPSQLVLINDPSSPREYVFHENVPPGGHISVNRDGSATIYNKDGQPVGQIAKPWAYDSLGRLQRTWYTVDNGDLVQHVDPEPNALYPILADPLSGGEDPSTGKSITATPLANGQEAVEGQPGGTQIVGTPDPGRTPFQPNTDTMLPDRQITVDQGNGDTEVTNTDSAGTPSTTTETTQQANADAAAAASQHQQFTDPDGGVWTQVEPDRANMPDGLPEGQTWWSTIVDGKQVIITVTKSADGTTTVLRDGVEYIYDQNGDLSSDFTPDPGRALERPIGPDAAVAGIIALDQRLKGVVPPEVSATAIGGLRHLEDEYTTPPPIEENKNYPGRDSRGRFLPGNEAGRLAKLAEQNALDDIQLFNPGLIRDQKRAAFPGIKSRTDDFPQVGRYYDGLVPKRDGTYTGLEIKSGGATRTRGQKIFDGNVSKSNPAIVKLSDGRQILVTDVQQIDVPAETGGGGR